MEFIPDEHSQETDVPYYEEASRVDGVVGHTTTKSLKELRALITAAFGRLSGSVVSIQSGKYGDRYAFRIFFTFNGVEGRMDIAVLPIRKETESRIDRAKRHALYSVWQRLLSEYNTMLVMPGDVPFMPYMLNSEGQTIMEFMRESGQIPALPATVAEIHEGEFTE